MSEEKKSDKFLTIQRVAEILSCTDKYIYILIQEGNLQAIKLGQRALRISENSLINFIVSRRVDPDDYFSMEETIKTNSTSPTEIVRSNWMNRK